MNVLEFQRRRSRLLAAIGPNGVAIVFGNTEVSRNGDTHYPFRQDSDFFYLTGFNESNAVLVLAPFHEKGETAIFVNPRDPSMEQWTGYRLGPERANEALGVDTAFSIQQLDTEILEFLQGREAVHALWNANTKLDPRIPEWLHALKRKRRDAPEDLVNLALSLHELRLIKSEQEQAQMQLATDISADAIKCAMRSCRPGMFEWQLDAEIQSVFLRNGAKAPAYPIIVGSGDNACIMHYIENSRKMTAQDLVLIDAGCELDHYAADITRTFPVDGRFSDAQRTLYELVLEAQTRAITFASVGNRFRDAHDASRKVLTQGLIELGILSCSIDEALEQNLDRRFLVHSCSHWLGLDVHDVGRTNDNGKPRCLEPGMVLTVEPGLYIPDNETMSDVEECWRGIGVRIEDDILITVEGNHVLSHKAPKSPDDIEALMHE